MNILRRTKELLLFLMLTTLGSSLSAVTAQTVGTVATLSASDGLALDAEGNLYATRYAFPPQFGTVFKVTPDGTVTTFLDNQPGPADLTFDAAGNLYVANFNSNSILKVSPTGEAATFASGFPLHGPLGLVFDDEQNLYVLNDLSPTVVRIDPSGAKQVAAVLPNNFGNGSGLTRDDEGNLYAASYSHGSVFKIDGDGRVTLFASSSAPGFGFILYVNGAFYATGIQSNRLYKFTMDGEVSVFAGTGIAGHVDGEAASAQFSGPNGLVASPSGDTLFIAEGGGYIRRVVLEPINTGLWEPDAVPQYMNLGQNYPNPFNPSTQIRYRLDRGQHVRLSVVDLLGKEVATLVDRHVTAGVYEVPFDASSLASGVYVYRLHAGGREITRKMVLAR